MTLWPAVAGTLHRLGAWHTLDRSIVVALAVSAVVAWAVVMVEPNREDDEAVAWLEPRQRSVPSRPGRAGGRCLGALDTD